jgi:hypothetical protein
MDNVKPINKWLITITVMLPTIMEIVETSLANVALPHMQGSLNAGTDIFVMFFQDPKLKYVRKILTTPHGNVRMKKIIKEIDDNT